MDTLQFKNWLEELDPNQDPDNDPALATTSRAAKVAVQAAVAQGKNPVQAAQKVVAQNTKVPLNKLGHIMPTMPGTNPNQKRM